MIKKDKFIIGHCVGVAIDVPIRQVFYYLLGVTRPKIGARVIVPFGRRKEIGVVVKYRDGPPKDMALKKIIQILDNEPLFSLEYVYFLQWVSSYYHHPIGEVWKSAMPGILRKGGEKKRGLVEWVITTKAYPKDWEKQLNRASRQLATMRYIIQHEGSITQAQLLKKHPKSRPALSVLLKKGWIHRSEEVISQRKVLNLAIDTLVKKVVLTDKQKVALNQLSIGLDNFSCRILAGITGSGKTEVYFALIEKVLKRGQQSLVLLPEIALTDQHYTRYFERFGSRVMQIHSGMSDVARYRVWWLVKSGEVDIVLTTRSGVFMMFKSLGLIIVDEEHDASYKQNEGLRYHARSIAIKRAHIAGIPIVLGSATPSLETLHNINKGRYKRVALDSRVGQSQLPEVRLIDVNLHSVQSGLSKPVIQAITHVLKENKQVLIFINRRGYAPILYCPFCQWTALCRRCDAQLSSHQHALLCHHCGARRMKPKRCGNCGETGLILLGEGTQKIEENLVQLFPKARVQRFDRDELNSANKLKTAMDKVHANKIDLLVGTQLLSKGHDFSDVDLVVVVNADQGLLSVDFRAPENLVQQLIQVAGRAGRNSKKGHVLIQSRFVNQPALQAVQKHQYAEFAKKELVQRELAGFPPYGFIALWRARGRHAHRTMVLLQAIAAVGRDDQLDDTQCYDVVQSPMFKRKGFYHVQLLVSANSRRTLHRWLSVWLVSLEKKKLDRSIKWSIDIDPISLL